MRTQYEIELRDRFAGQALMGILAHPETGIVPEEEVDEVRDEIVRSAYSFADLMMLERVRSMRDDETP